MNSRYLDNLTEEKAKGLASAILDQVGSATEYYRVVCERNTKESSKARLQEIGRELGIIVSRCKKLLEMEYDHDYFKEALTNIGEMIKSQSVDLGLMAMGNSPISELRKLHEEGKKINIKDTLSSVPTALFIKIKNKE